MGVNSLPKTVTRQRRGCDFNPGPESSTLPSHPGLIGTFYICDRFFKIVRLWTVIEIYFG